MRPADDATGQRPARSQSGPTPSALAKMVETNNFMPNIKRWSKQNAPSAAWAATAASATADMDSDTGSGSGGGTIEARFKAIEEEQAKVRREMGEIATTVKDIGTNMNAGFQRIMQGQQQGMAALLTRIQGTDTSAALIETAVSNIPGAPFVVPAPTAAAVVGYGGSGAAAAGTGAEEGGAPSDVTVVVTETAAEHEVWFSDGMTAARSGQVTAIDDDGRCTVVDEEGDKHEQLKREQICHQWQLEEMDDTDGPDAAGMATCRDRRRAAEIVERLAVTEPRPEDTAILFRRNEEGREFRRRVVAGELTPHDISRVPEGVSEVSSTRFCLAQKTGLSVPGQSLTRAIRARWFHFRCRNPAVRLFPGC